MKNKTKDKIIQAWESAYKGDDFTTGEDYYYETYEKKKDRCCNNDNPDDMCDNCDCWKKTRANCS